MWTFINARGDIWTADGSLFDADQARRHAAINGAAYLYDGRLRGDFRPRA